MINSTGLQYAQAIFDLAKENKSASDYYQALLVINDAIIKDEEINKVFAHPSITLGEKKSILEKSLSSNVDEVLIHFLFVLLDNNRLFELPLIIEAYKELLDEYENKMEVDVYSKYPLDSKTKEELVAKLEKHYQKTIIINEHLDDNVIGGVKIVSNKEVLDSSVLSTLDNMKNSLKKGW